MPLGFCLKNLLILHPVTEDRKPYQLGEKDFYGYGRKKSHRSTSVVVWDVIFVICRGAFSFSDCFNCGSMFPCRLAVVYVAKN